MQLALDYLTDPDLQALLQLWWADGKPPFVLRDWLLDRGLEGQAECVKWVENSCIERPAIPFKSLESGERYYWGISGLDETKLFGHYLPKRLLQIVDTFGDTREPSEYGGKWPAFTTTVRAYCGLLDGYAKWKGHIE